MSHTIIKAEKEASGSNLWVVEYKEFPGTYFLHDTEYQLEIAKEEIFRNMKGVTPEDIETLLDLQAEVIEHNHRMEECL